MKNKLIRSLSLFTTLSLLVVFFTGCNDNKSEETVVSYTIAGDPKNLDPLIATDTESNIILANVFEGLVNTAPDGSIIAGCASKYEISNNDLTYTFYLREDLKWSNDTPLTAKDFEFAFQRMFAPQTKSTNVSPYLCIKNGQKVLNGQLSADQLGVKALDNYTLQIQLEYANPSFLYALSRPPASPCNKEFFLSTEGRYGTSRKQTIYNGPYKITGHKEKSYVILKKNTDYVSGITPTINQVTFYIDNEEDAVYNRLKSNKSDAGFITSDQIEHFSEKKYNITEIPNTTWVLGFNFKNSVFSNANIRKAFTSSFSANWAKEDKTAGYSAAELLIGDKVLYNRKIFREFAGDTHKHKYNPQQGKEFLKQGMNELGIKAMPKLTIHCPNKPLFKHIMPKFQGILQKELALFLNIKYLNDEELNEVIASNNFQIVVYPVVSEGDPLKTMFEQFTSQSNKNYINYSTSDYDRLVAKALSSDNPDEVLTLLKQAEIKLFSDTAIIPIAFENSYFVNNAKITGLSPFEMSPIIYFKYAQFIQK